MTASSDRDGREEMRGGELLNKLLSDNDNIIIMTLITMIMENLIHMMY